MLFLILLASLYAQAELVFNPPYEGSFPRDNTYCSQDKVRVEFLIRGGSKYTQPDNRLYGENIFYQFKNEKPQYLQTPEAGYFRLLKGKSTLCTKGHGYKINKDKHALLLLKENRPFKDKLLIQFFNAKTLRPEDAIQTTYQIDKARKIKNGFSFRTYPDHPLKELQQVEHESVKYLYQEKEFPTWIDYTEKGFALNPKKTFKDFQYKKFFKSEKDFLTHTGWNEAEKVFKKSFLFHGVSHQQKKECILFTDKPDELLKEQWQCQAMNAE